MRILIKFSYDGTNYSGFQSQKGLDTIEKRMNEALTKINNGKKTSITATGRTDKGVHALSQYGTADVDVNITEKKLKKLEASIVLCKNPTPKDSIPRFLIPTHSTQFQYIDIVSG